MSKTLSCVIIDDNPQAISVLKNLLTSYFPEVDIIGEAVTVADGVILLKEKAPHILFLDVEMPTENGTAIFDYVDTPSFETIFTTAYPDYAAQAFRLGSIDYLVKPVKPSELKEAISKVKKKLIEGSIVETIKPGYDQSDRITFSHANALEIYTICDILYCTAESNYTIVQGFDKKSIVSKTLGHYEELLKPYGFFRVNRSHLINLKHVDSVDKTDFEVILKNQTRISISSRRRKEFMEILTQGPGVD